MANIYPVIRLCRTCREYKGHRSFDGVEIDCKLCKQNMQGTEWAYEGTVFYHRCNRCKSDDLNKFKDFYQKANGIVMNTCKWCLSEMKKEKKDGIH